MVGGATSKGAGGVEVGRWWVQMKRREIERGERTSSSRRRSNDQGIEEIKKRRRRKRRRGRIMEEEWEDK